MNDSTKPFLTVGDPMPALTLPTVSGGTLNLGDLRGEKYILFMWASW